MNFESKRSLAVHGWTNPEVGNAGSILVGDEADDVDTEGWQDLCGNIEIGGWES
jgi:hypothetical protein